jgi:5-hydroxyisourate hydrolase-like protein (transthyretin family)
VRSRLLAGVVTIGVASALLTVPAVPASAATSSQTFEGLSLGSINGQAGWQVLGAAYDVAVADTSAVYAGALGTRALRMSNAVTSGSFGDQLFSQALPDEAGETSAENAGLGGGTRQTRYSASFTFASADPAAEQPGLSLGLSPDRGDGARMSLVRLYDTPTGLRVTGFGFDASDLSFPETVIATGLDRSVPHTFSLVMDLVDGENNDRVAVSIDGATPVVIGSWEEYFRQGEGNPTRTVDSLLFRASGTAQPANAGKGFFIDGLTQTTTLTPEPAVTARVIDPTDLVTHVGGWQAFREIDWPSSATGRITSGPAGALGDGSFRVDLGPVTTNPANGVDNNGKYYLGRTLPGVPLGDVTGLSYRVLTDPANTGAAQPYTMLTVAGGGATYANLVYDPSDAASNPDPVPTTNGVWRTFDPFSPTAKWRNTRAIAGKATWTYRTLTEWLQLAPDLRLHPALGGVYLAFGASSVSPTWTDYVAHVDGLDLTVAGARTVDSFAPGAPLSPTSITASDLLPRSATLSWIPDPAVGYAPVDGYEVIVDGTPHTVSGTTLTFDVAPLTPGSTHRAAVRAVRGAEHGPWVSTSFETPTIPTPAAVTGLTASGITRTAATIGWDASAVVGDGAVDSYEVTVDGAPSVVGAGTTTRALSGLLPGSSHTVSVRARNESGWGDPVSVTFTTNDLDRRTPGAPTLVVGDPDIDGIVPVSWTPNAGDSADFPVVSWIVSVDGADEATLPAATTAYDVIGLADGRHTISVRGVNALGSAAFAAQVIIVESQNATLPEVSLTAAPATVKPGGSTTLTSVFGVDGVPAADAVVSLWRRSGASWALVATTLTDDEGAARFVVRPSSTTLYRAVTAGLPSAYATVTVGTKVAPTVTAKVLKKRKGSLTVVTVRATMSPRPTGATVQLQRQKGASWRVVSTATVGSAAAVKLKAGTVRVLKKGTYRVVVSASATTKAVTSRTFTIKLARR